jgi:hypothetical protein
MKPKLELVKTENDDEFGEVALIRIGRLADTYDICEVKAVSGRLIGYGVLDRDENLRMMKPTHDEAFQWANEELDRDEAAARLGQKRILTSDLKLRKPNR